MVRLAQGKIELEDGRTLPANYRQFDHGYAVTAHRSQGKTVDAVIVSGDRMTQELFYVAASRGRESLTVITSDSEQLRESIGISGERQSATELARKAEVSASLPRLPGFGAEPNIESAREWVLRQAVLSRTVEPAPSKEIGLAEVLNKAQKPEHKKEIGYGNSISF